MTIGGFSLDFAQLATLVAALATLVAQVHTRLKSRIKEQKIDAVAHEVKPNGGASLRDAIDRIERKVGTLADRIDVLESRRRTFWRR